MTTTSTKPINRVLIANRGEIACRVIATLRRLGIESVAVYSDADANAQHVRDADLSVWIGPAPAAESYLRIDAVVDAARRSGADAVHPGYGFLSENQHFAAALADAGIIFLGPPATAIATMGDKISARAAVVERGVPVVPGLSRPDLTDYELIAAAPEIGFPVLIKPSAGGGGKGMHRVEDADALAAALVTARREAAAAFGDDTLFLEHFVDTPRHIEVQILADQHGNVIHLGERECSLQRRHQKVIEEAPSALLDAATRERIGQAACDAARSVSYVGAGTVEFIVSARRPDEFFFMEMNTRLQVEHPVTEMITGVDLVEQQIRVAAGERLSLSQNDIQLTGYAVEARVYAEDPAAGFLPTGGTIVAVDHPVPPNAPTAGPIRADSAMRDGLVVGSDYDPMLAKIIAYGHDRATALVRLDAALSRTHVLGVGTNIDFCRFVLARPEVAAGELDTELLDRLVIDYAAPATDPVAVARVALHQTGLDGHQGLDTTPRLAPRRHSTTGWGATGDRGRSQPRWSSAGEGVLGRSHSGWSSAGEGVLGRSHSGWSSAGEGVLGRSHSGWSSAGEGVLGRSHSGWSSAGEGVLGRSHSGWSSAGEGVSGRSHSGWSSAGEALAEPVYRDHGLWHTAIGWRIGDTAALRHTVTDGTRIFVSELVPGPTWTEATITADDESSWSATISATETMLTVDGLAQHWSVAVDADGVSWVAGPTGTWALRPVHVLTDDVDTEHAGDITSPMPGTIVAVSAADGAEVKAGDVVVVVEAMKMEHALRAPTEGVVAVKVAVGDKVKANQLLAQVQATLSSESENQEEKA
ncbi:biotin carboxylase N-terminal domain-containing protein [Gordonia sp. CPCC 205333]|uniref:acetyl/propionyl/methylcrotonyl-CoA carboxylase subunit alpha n=1 Tax=Gordonia sp. CPCC 205333 TaxID=3140790 RepID=UPI003AF3BF4B